jgi:hypothetical protein
MQLCWLSMGSVRIVAAYDATRESKVRAKWEDLMDQYAGTTLFYQSPEYCDHLAKSCVDCSFLAIIDGDDGAPIGIVPMCKSPVLLKLEVRGHCYASASFSGIQILGGTLLAPQSPEVFKLLFQQIAVLFPDCDAIEVKGLSTTSLLWDFLRNGQSLKKDFKIYAPYGARNCQTAAVMDSFNDYLGAFSHKKKYNLKRQIRRLNDFGAGSLALQRIDCVSAVKCFLDARITLGRHARWNDREISEVEVLNLAERGLLLSYVLSVNGKPCALAFGTRYRGTLLLHFFRHDTEIGHLSPGTVMQTLMMKDLAEQKLVRRIDYGFGEPRYRLINDVDQRVTAIMLRKGIVNQSAIIAHLSFVRLLGGVKRLKRIGHVLQAMWGSKDA